MTTRGFEHIYLETHNWGKAVAFWQALGFKLDFETDHGSGQLVASNGTRLFIAETSPEDPAGMDVYLGADQAGVPAPEGVDVVFDWTPTHWGTQVMTVRDPDGRLFRIEAPAAGE
ncbi:MAG TPA: VOC family protein [Acidimicrobiia bacterium]|jgi:catechol 2,3-dioxygenase-like lactoylglutathione lyase family enzyme|nr:VOC family protein [Acidimicrobiia bacterium]